LSGWRDSNSRPLISHERKDKLVEEEYHPFKNFSFTKYRRTKTRKRAIAKEDMMKIYLDSFDNDVLDVNFIFG